MSSFTFDSMEKIQEEAKRLNCEVVVAADNELQFDIDSDTSQATFLEFYRVKLYNRYNRTLLPHKTWKSKSGNTHIVVTLPESLEVAERIALQAIGGSDARREFAALNCYLAGSPHPILLYKPITMENLILEKTLFGKDNK